MADLFDSTQDVAEAVARLKLIAPHLDADDSAALRVLLEDRERLLGVAAQARQVRECQRRYFRERTDTALSESKAAERKLDGMLKD